jgi:hypothetical protein
MRREYRWGLVAALALIIGSVGAGAYARLAAPFFLAATRMIAAGHPWTIVSVEVAPSKTGPGSVLRLIGEVRRDARDEAAAASVQARVNVGEVVEGPVVFWTLLLLWPASSFRRRLIYLAAGVPIFLALEAATTGVQLMHDLPAVSRMIQGDDMPLTNWDRWSHFLEFDGKFAVELFGVLATVALARSFPWRHRPGVT